MTFEKGTANGKRYIFRCRQCKKNCTLKATLPKSLPTKMEPIEAPCHFGNGKTAKWSLYRRRWN